MRLWWWLLDTSYNTNHLAWPRLKHFLECENLSDETRKVLSKNQTELSTPRRKLRRNKTKSNSWFWAWSFAYKWQYWDQRWNLNGFYRLNEIRPAMVWTQNVPQKSHVWGGDWGMGQITEGVSCKGIYLFPAAPFSLFSGSHGLSTFSLPGPSVLLFLPWSQQSWAETVSQNKPGVH